MLTLETRLESIHGIGPRFLARLEALDIVTVRDLLWHFPARYEDFSQIYRIADLEPGQQATVQGQIENIETRRTWRKRMIVIEATISDESGTIRAVWFNQPYIKNVLRPGSLANLSGKVAHSESEHDLFLSHPTYELVGSHETKHTGRLVPIYPETRGLTSKGIRFLVQPILEHLGDIPEWIPHSVREQEHLPELTQSLRNIHFPASLEDATAARRRFAFEDLYLLQLMNLRAKSMLARESAPVIPTDIEGLKKILTELPFMLTESQKRSLWDVMRDMERGTPMNRLLQGDVGSGKTVIAALAAIIAAQAGYQTAIMAPTEVLAHQHYGTFKKLFKHIRTVEQPSIALLTAHDATLLHETDLEENVTKSVLVKRIVSGAAKIVIGTHAVIQKSIAFAHLGLAIIDEQHRFGVNQRALLAKSMGRTARGPLPHFLSMSATPIPRTIMMTVFGDLDLSTITELPSGRKPIRTSIIPPEGRDKAYAFIWAQIHAGRQAFVICPRIDPPKAEESPSRPSARQIQLWEVRSVTEEFEKLSKNIFPDLRVAMLHGQLKPKEKDAIMKKFRAGETDILVSTSVIEVGVDVPNATIMMIEGSDRFGLAQLYQFRGRVGRGEHQSYCFLFTDSSSTSTKERLKAIVEAKNGFELAERDLQIRGPGEFLGQKQTGLPDVAMSGLQNTDLIRASRKAAEETLKNDPRLADEPELSARIQAFEKKVHFE